MPGQEEQFKVTQLSCLSGVAGQTLKKLERLELRNFYDLLLNLPFRYEDRTYLRPIKSDMESDSSCSFLLMITSAPQFKERRTEIKARDIEGNKVNLVFFRNIKFLFEHLNPGTLIVAWGHLRYWSHNFPPSIVHPDLTFINGEDKVIELPTRLSPIYHLTAGISQTRMRELTCKVLKHLVKHPLEEFLPRTLNPFNMDFTTALLLTHNPEPRADHGVVYLEALPSFQRICYEELVAYKLCILELKSRQKALKAPAITLKPEVQQQLLATLPFEPTQAQSRVFQEIMADCVKSDAMSRLVHGDVGSGKTLVAAMVMLQFASNGMQAAMMAPTELLAKQHQQKLSNFFKPLGYEVALVTRNLKKKERIALFNQAKDGQIKIFVGTHALFQKELHYQNLSLVIVDEQHRFGVDQREALLNKAPEGMTAHELLMTATPIPRSLQQALFADTDVSTIDQLPKGRTPITTLIAGTSEIDELVRRASFHCQQGEQVYWVCPHIEETEEGDSSSAKRRFKFLSEMLPDTSIGLLHAQLSEKVKNETMEQFVSGELKILVATTIVEVGVDVPNATVIVIENADNLGLAQLHQLRGRVGRGTKASYCILLYQNDNQENIQEQPSKQQLERKERGQQRLRIMQSTDNGFEIANQDLIMRGPGEFFGANQSGKENFRFADLNRDYDLIDQAQKAAVAIFKDDLPTARNLILRWFPSVLDTSNGTPSPQMEAV